MSGRGTFAIGNNVDYTYETIDKIEGVKVLSGKNGSMDCQRNLIQVQHILS